MLQWQRKNVLLDHPTSAVMAAEGWTCLWDRIGIHLSGPSYQNTQILIRVRHFKGEDMWRVYPVAKDDHSGWVNQLTQTLFDTEGAPRF
jgi:hypothetical protein